MLFDSHFTEFIALSITGVGMILLVLFRAMSKKWPFFIQVFGNITLTAICGYISYFLTDNIRNLYCTLGLIGLYVTPSWLLSIPSCQDCLKRLFATLNQPLCRCFLGGAVGLGLIVISAIRFDHADNAWLESQDTWLAEVASRPLTTPIENEAIITDRGRKILVAQPKEMRDSQTVSQLEANIMKEMPYRFTIIRREEPSDICNCHGWAFTEGKYWIGGEDVQKILDDNGYQEVKTPQPGDLAIFREGDSITHTSVVRYVTEGQPVVVEGKWGWMGVFLHVVDQGAYGRNFTYYRTPRTSHVLVGINSTSSPTSTPTTTYTSVPTVANEGANLSSSNGGN